MHALVSINELFSEAQNANSDGRASQNGYASSAKKFQT